MNWVNHAVSSAPEIFLFIAVGIGTILGPLLGAIGMPWLSQHLQFLQEYRYVVFGPLVILLVIFVPNGGLDAKYSLTSSRHALTLSRSDRSP